MGTTVLEKVTKMKNINLAQYGGLNHQNYTNSVCFYPWEQYTFSSIAVLSVFTWRCQPSNILILEMHKAKRRGLVCPSISFVSAL